MDTKELLKKVRKIEIKTKGLSRHLFSGEYHSAFKGRGMSFSEVRNYQFGDDVRNIDWNVTARTGEPYIKVFEEERELTLMLLVDFSGSSFFGTRKRMKNELIVELAAVLSFSAMNNNDKVGLLCFADEVELFLPPKKGKGHILRIIRELINFKPSGTSTNLKSALEYFNNVIKKRAICFILSDFITEGYEEPLRIACKRHDLIGLHITDPTEKELPNVGLIKALDSESGKSKWLDTSSKAIREKYAEAFRTNQDKFTKTMRSSGGDILEVNTAESYINQLLQFFKRRSR